MNIATGTQNCFLQIANPFKEQYTLSPSTITVNITATTIMIPTPLPWPAARPFAPALIANTPAPTLKGTVRLTLLNGTGDSTYAGVPIQLPDRSKYCITQDIPHGYGNLGFETVLDPGPNTMAFNVGPFALPTVSSVSVTPTINASKYNPVNVVATARCTISGKVKSGTKAFELLGNTLDGISSMLIQAYDSSSGALLGSAVSDNNGNYSLVSYTGPTFRVTPGLSAGQSINDPASGQYLVTPTAPPGSQTMVTVTGNDFYLTVNGNGTIGGALTLNGLSIVEGLAVLVSTYSLPGGNNPPPITPGFRSQGIVLYTGVADGAGNYSISLPSGSGYLLSCWYNGIKKEISPVTVAASATTTENISWP
jgi:hypothetical protein